MISILWNLLQLYGPGFGLFWLTLYVHGGKICNLQLLVVYV